jgi:hypothetical protein
MREQEIIEGNKLIALFHRGGKIVKGTGAMKGFDAIEYPRSEGGWYGGRDLIDSLKYHESWDLLMPVVKKIRPLWKLSQEHDAAALMQSCFNADIDGVWNIVVHFIQWLNSEQNPETSVATGDAKKSLS